VLIISAAGEELMNEVLNTIKAIDESYQPYQNAFGVVEFAGGGTSIEGVLGQILQNANVSSTSQPRGGNRGGRNNNFNFQNRNRQQNGRNFNFGNFGGNNGRGGRGR
jgi:hypothetical protein